MLHSIATYLAVIGNVVSGVYVASSARRTGTFDVKLSR